MLKPAEVPALWETSSTLNPFPRGRWELICSLPLPENEGIDVQQFRWEWAINFCQSTRGASPTWL